MLAGFKCPRDGRNSNFDFCHTVCSPRCRPLPLLLALATEGRATEPGTYHVTELPNPPQVVYLKRNFPYYVPPDDFTWMMFGTAIHSIVEHQKRRLEELGVGDDYQQECGFTAEFEELPGVKLKGRADLYIVSEKKLVDFKSMKFYYDLMKILVERQPVESVKPDMVFQLNCYRTFGFPGAEKLEIEALIKDHSRKIQKMYGIAPIENFSVPVWPAEKTRAKTLEYLRGQLEVQSTGNPRRCSDEERWYNAKSKEFIRCADYCAVADICPQHQQTLEDRKR